MPCPSCGYDLRAVAGGRCPECGFEVDAVSLQRSEIPWANRRKIGWVRAYFKTAWQFIRRRGNLSVEVGRPQDLLEGRSFSRITGVLLAAILIGVWGLVLRTFKGRAYEALAVMSDEGGRYSFYRGPLRAPWLDDLLVPWSAGVTLGWVIPVALTLFAFHLATVQRTVFRLRGKSVDLKRAAAAIGSYTSAPLLLIGPAMVLYETGRIIVRYQGSTSQPTRSSLLDVLMVGLMCGGGLLLLISMALAHLRVGQWVARITGGGSGRGFLAAGELALLWVIGAVLFLGLFPWCIGFGWIVFDSFL